MKFLIDVCASSRLRQETLTNLGYDVVSAREGFSKASDEDLLALARREKRVLVTKDKDIGELVFLRRIPHSCIVRLVDMSVRQEAEAMTVLIGSHQDSLLEETLIVVNNDHIRIRRSLLGE